MPEESISEFLKVEEVQQTSQNFLDALTNQQLQQQLLPLKITFIVFIFLFSVIIIYLFFKTSLRNWGRLEAMQEFSQTNSLVSSKLLTRKWKKIKKGADSGSETQRKLSLAKAYHLFDEILARQGFSQAGLMAKLDVLSLDAMPSLAELKKAVEVCNNVLRDESYVLDQEQSKQAIHAFGRALVDFELL